MSYVNNETEIPSEDLAKIRARLISQINSMSEAELRIVSRTEKDFRDFIADIFKAIAATLGYIVGAIVGTSEQILGEVKTGFREGWKMGKTSSLPSDNPIVGFLIIAIITFVLVLIFK